jgi:hypothetical protein
MPGSVGQTINVLGAEFRSDVVTPTIGQPCIETRRYLLWNSIQILSEHAYSVPTFMKVTCKRRIVYLDSVSVHTAPARFFDVVEVPPTEKL